MKAFHKFAARILCVATKIRILYTIEISRVTINYNKNVIYKNISDLNHLQKKVRIHLLRSQLLQEKYAFNMFVCGQNLKDYLNLEDSFR